MVSGLLYNTICKRLSLQTMDVCKQLSLSHVCSGCERSFSGPGPLNFHCRSCRLTKCQLQGALAKARELWERQKRLKFHTVDHSQAGNALCVTYPIATPTLTLASCESNPTAHSMADIEMPLSSHIDEQGAPPHITNVVCVVHGSRGRLLNYMR